ncbi:MAG: peroxiredoxin family protein [Actinomycetota bacterium]|nr:peroxiredoxin family protein [Actinomycetota bacterium]
MNAVVLVLVVVQLLLLIVLVGVVYQLFQQQGRLLLQIESLEQMIPEALEAGATPAPPRGIPVAAPIPPFELPDVDDAVIRLEDFEGRRMLLVNWSTTCGFCEAIVEDLAKLQPRLEKRGVDVVLVSRGDPEENRRMVEGHGLRARILLQPGEIGMIDAFARTGTPAAYLVDEHGRVAKPMALGADQVPELAREAAGRQLGLATERPLSESRLMRDGLPPGSPAPAFELPSVLGDKVSLEQLRGSEALLVFSDPECGPCEGLAADLARWHRDQADDAPPVVMISRGDREVNRRKVEEYGIGFPVAIQPAWKVSKAYGIFSTPVGFLIDANGVILREVARGPEAVMALADDAMRHRKEAATR